jgi:hypothetical protein
MSKGKLAAWNITIPLRPDSIFHVLADKCETDQQFSATARSGIEGIPSAFINLYGLSNSSAAENNLYYVAAHTLSPLLHIECDQLF